MTAILTAQNLDKAFGTRRVLTGVSFAVHEGDRIGLVGLNGSGKSTLLKLLMQSGQGGLRGQSGLVGKDADDAPDAGLITRARNLTVEYVPQEPRLDPNQRVLESLREGLSDYIALMAALADVEGTLASASGERLSAAIERQAQLHADIQASGGWDRDHEIRGLSAALSLPSHDALIGTLSLGERRRIAIARALLARPALLALDEPTNHLDAETTAWLETRLLERKGTLLLVTHDRYFLDRVATRILELDRGHLYAYEGGYRDFLDKQAERLETESQQDRARAMFIRRELSWIRRGPSARGTKQKARIDRFDAAVDAHGAAERTGGPPVLRLGIGPSRLGKTILELDGLGKSLGGKLLFRDLTLVFKPGDRIGVVGPNGVGKSTLVRTILGEVAPDTGRVVPGKNTAFAFLDQGRADLVDTRTVLEEVAGDSDQVALADGNVHARTFLRMLLFDDAFANTPVGVLSGGERNRVQLAKLLRKGGNFLILDEPTNDLDLKTLGVLEEALANFGGCALVVSHDRWFLDRVATGILAFEGDGNVVFYEGSCSDYLAKVEGRRSGEESARAADVEVAPRTPTKTKPPTGKSAAADKPRKLSFREREELAKIEETIVAAEGEVSRLEAVLADPSFYQTRSAEAPALVAQTEAAAAEVERLYARWQELAAIAEAAKPG